MNTRTQRLVVAAAMATGVAGAVLVPTLSAVAASSPGAGLKITVGATKIVARGAAVQETVTYTCPKGAMNAVLDVTLFEKVRREVTRGDGYDPDIVCNGRSHKEVLGVTGNQRPWSKGSAFNAATVSYQRPDYSTAQISEQKVVQLTG